MSADPRPVDLPAEVWACLEGASASVTGPEIVRLRRLFFDGLLPLRETLERLFGERATLQGVFCHGDPIVDFSHPEAPSTPRGCELGDLLIVVNHLLPGSRQRGRSLLLQFKLENGSVPARQRLLYRDWPDFSYRRDPSVARSVKGGAHPGAQFAFFMDGRSTLVAQDAVVPPSSWESSLAVAIADMLTSHLRGGALLLPEDELPDACGWSEVVWDLLGLMFSSSTYSGASRAIDPSAVAFELLERPPELLASSTFAPSAGRLWQEMRGASDGRAGPPPIVEGDQPPPAGPGTSVVLIEIDGRLD